MALTQARTLELEQLLTDMQRASDAVYALFFRMNFGGRCHAFVEFVGLQNEYIRMCRDLLAQGVDFAAVSVHAPGGDLPVIGHHRVAYLKEKLTCIYGPLLGAVDFSGRKIMRE